MRDDKLTLKAFLIKWRNGLERKSVLWEGPAATRELRGSRYPVASSLSDSHPKWSALTFVRCDPGQGYRPEEMMSKIFDEVTDYIREKSRWQQEYKDRMTTRRKDFQEARNLLAKIRRNAKLKARQLGDVELKQMFGSLLDQIETHESNLNSLFGGGNRSQLGAWELMWPKNPRTKADEHEIELDNRLQLQMAKMFAIFLLAEPNGISLRTIARLVVLAYWAAGLAEKGAKGPLVLLGSKRAITRRSVEEKLLRAKLNRIKSRQALVG